MPEGRQERWGYYQQETGNADSRRAIVPRGSGKCQGGHGDITPLRRMYCTGPAVGASKSTVADPGQISGNSLYTIDVEGRRSVAEEMYSEDFPYKTRIFNRY